LYIIHVDVNGIYRVFSLLFAFYAVSCSSVSVAAGGVPHYAFYSPVAGKTSSLLSSRRLLTTVAQTRQELTAEPTAPAKVTLHYYSSCHSDNCLVSPCNHQHLPK